MERKVCLLKYIVSVAVLNLQSRVQVGVVVPVHVEVRVSNSKPHLILLLFSLIAWNIIKFLK